MQDSVIPSIRHALSFRPRSTLSEGTLTPAGVMLLLYQKSGEYHLLLNKRSQHVEDHKGEISFPGGRMDEGDRGLLETALRETHEEMGVLPADVDVLGELDEVATISRYRVSPFVGAVPESYKFRPNESEVAEVIEAPLGELVRSDAARDEVRMVRGEPVHLASYVFRGHVIWGATGRILQSFLEVLDSVPEKEASWKSKRA